MSQTAKRNQDKRKCTENSERKWKDTVEDVDEDYDPLPEVLIRSLEKANPPAVHQTFSDSMFNHIESSGNCSQPEQQESYRSVKCDCNGHTDLDDSLLKEIILSLACPTCYTKEPLFNYSKTSNNRLEKISITCKKCEQIIFSKALADSDIKRECFCMKKTYTCVGGDSNSEEKKCNTASHGSSGNVELLVCDVDVMKQGNEADGQEKDDYIQGINTSASGYESALTDQRSKEGLRAGIANEDQLLFDSLPAILSNANGQVEGNNQSYQIPVHPKKRRLENYNEGYGDENHYYMWHDYGENNLQNQEPVPCNNLLRRNKKRKARSEFQYQFWKKEDEKQILSYFTEMIKAMKVPGKDACQEFLKKYPHINTDWTRVKYKVYNQIQKQKKKSLADDTA